jgi:hypothetical protein
MAIKDQNNPLGIVVNNSANIGAMKDDSLLNQFKAQKEAKDLVAWVRAEYQKCKSARKLEEQEWYLQLSFYNGYQYHSWKNIGKNQVLAEEPNPQSLPRVTINRIEPIIRTEIAKTTSGHPSATVIPASNDEDDLMAAQAAEQVWEAIYNKNHFQTQVLQAGEFWRATTGNSFIKTYWDSSIKEVTPTPMVDPFTQNKTISQEVTAIGDVKFEVVSPFHLYVPDLSEADIEAQPYIFNVYTKSEDWVKRTFKNVLPKNFQPARVSTSEILDAALMDLRGIDTAKPNSVLVIEMWCKPGGNRWLPNGGLVTIVDQEIVQMADNGIPYVHGQYPFAHLYSIPTGKFYRRGTIKSLIPIQREYNRTRSQIIHAKNLMAKPMMMYQEGSTDPRKVTARPGTWVPIRPGFQYPTPIPLTPLPNYVLNEVQQLQADFEDLSGQHQVSRGEAGSGVTAATAINYLQERDDAYLTTVFSSIEAAVEKVAKQSLSLFVQYVDQPRLIKTVGDDGSFDASILAGADIASGTDIRIESGSALPTSKSARQALITDWMKMGFISPQDGLKILDMGMLQQYYNVMKLDENQAQRENLMMKRLDEQQIQQFQMQWEQGASMGQPDKVVPGQVDANGQPVPLATPPVVQVHDYDNHAVHIEIHNRFRKSQSFDLLPPLVRAEFEKHISMHKAALQQQQAEQAQAMMAQQAAQGAPHPAPNASAGTGLTSEQLQQG